MAFCLTYPIIHRNLFVFLSIRHAGSEQHPSPIMGTWQQGPWGKVTLQAAVGVTAATAAATAEGLFWTFSLAAFHFFIVAPVTLSPIKPLSLPLGGLRWLGQWKQECHLTQSCNDVSFPVLCGERKKSRYWIEGKKSRTCLWNELSWTEADVRHVGGDIALPEVPLKFCCCLLCYDPFKLVRGWQTARHQKQA